MTSQNQSRFRNIAFLAAVLVLTLTLAAAATQADTSTAVVRATAGLVPDVPAPLVLNYQGRLADPLTGAAKSDGIYQMSFSLYDVDPSSSPLWTETKDVTVKGGLFSTRLGDTTALPAIFDGRALWLGITVGGDPQATPRLPIGFVAYALYANRASTAGVATTAELAANADRLGGQLPASYASASHTHDAIHIASGNLSTDRYRAIDDLSAEGFLGNAANDLALNNGTVQATLNADLLDGVHAAGFATASHNHDSVYVNVTGDNMSGQLGVGPTTGNTIVGVSSDLATNYAGVFGSNTGNGYGVRGSSTNNYGGFFYSTNMAGLLADTKTSGGPDLVLGGSDGDGQLSVEPASGANLTLSSENDVKVRLDKDNNGSGIFRVQNSGGSDVVTANEAGVVSASKIGYTTARTHYASVPGEAFSPWSDVAYSNSGGCGGADIETAGCFAMVAPVQLPDGATINQFTVYFYDVSANDMSVTLYRQSYTSCGYVSLASVNSSGTAGYYSRAASLSVGVDNTTGGYFVNAHSCNWAGINLMIKGAVIRYTISEAP